MTGTPARRLLVFAVIALIALVGASTFIDEGEPDAAPDPDESSPVEYIEPEPSPVIETDLETTVIEEDETAQQFALPAQPVLRIDELTLSDEPFTKFSKTLLAGDDLIVFGGADSIDRLVVLDIATGEPRWELQGEDALPGADETTWAPPHSGWDFAPPAVVQGPDGWLVLIPYTDRYSRAAGEPWEQGVAALSADDGSVQWLAPLIDYQPDDPINLSIDGLSVGGGTIVANVRIVRTDNTSAPLPAEAFADARTVALDASDGSMLWEATGAAVLAVAGGTVYTADAEAAELGATAQVTGRDLATGTELWTFAEEDRYVLVNNVAAGAAMFQLFEDPEFASSAARSVLIDAATGEALASVNANVNCASDIATRMACTFRDLGGDEPVLQLFTFDAAAPGIGIAADPLPESLGYPNAVLAGWIIMETMPEDVVVDASGDAISEAKPFGILAAASETHVVMAGRGDGALLYDLSVYALG